MPSAVAAQIAQLANRSIGVSETAVMLEFTSAAAGGLDHYSAFLTADQLRDIYSQIEGNFVGLGVELKADKGACLIVHVIPNSPAEQAGIHEGDRITAVDGQQTKSLSTDEAASLLTGEEGSTCHVTVVTAGQSPRELSGPPSPASMSPASKASRSSIPTNGVAYIRIPAFQKTTPADLETALWDLQRQGMQKLDHRPPRQPRRPAHRQRRSRRQVHRRRRHRLDQRSQRTRKLQLPRPPPRHLASSARRADRRRQRQCQRNLRRCDQRSGRGKIVGAAPTAKVQSKASSRSARRCRCPLDHRQVLLAARSPDCQRRRHARYRRASWQAGGRR